MRRGAAGRLCRMRRSDRRGRESRSSPQSGYRRSPATGLSGGRPAKDCGRLGSGGWPERAKTADAHLPGDHRVCSRVCPSAKVRCDLVLRRRFRAHSWSLGNSLELRAENPESPRSRYRLRRSSSRSQAAESGCCGTRPRRCDAARRWGSAAAAIRSRAGRRASRFPNAGRGALGPVWR